MKYCLVLLLAALCTHVQAQAIYKCVDRKGPPVYQSHPCGPHQRVAAVRTYQASAPDPAIDAANRRVAAEMQRRNAAARGWQGGRAGNAAGNARDAQRSRCAAARHSREATLERVGLRRTYALLSSLDAQVAAACKGL